MKEKNELAGHLLAITCILIWGTTFIFSKILLRSFTPVEIILFRYTAAYLALLAAFPKPLGLKKKKHELMFMAAGLMSVTLYGPLENLALSYSTAANVSVLVSTAPFFVALLASIFLKGEKPTLMFYIGFAVAIIGIALISYNGATELKLNPLGDLMALLSAVSWAIYSIILKKINEQGYNPVAVTRRCFLWGAAFLVPVNLAAGKGLNLSRFANTESLFLMLFLALAASAGCFVMWNLAVRKIGAVRSSAYIYVIPVVTVVASLIMLGDKPTVVSLVGIALTVSGLVISDIKPRKSKVCE